MREASTARRRTIDLPEFSGHRVLAVDDTAVNREVLNEALTSFGVAADFAESGEEAIEKVGGREFDIIFMDCSMPDMDGFAATEAIRTLEQAEGRNPATVIALTAHVGGVAAMRWQEAGMDAYVAKPFTLPQLISVMTPVANRAAGEPASLHRDIAAAGRQPSPSRPWEVAPLIAQETLDMFATLSGVNGSSVADRVFGLFGTHAPKGFQDLAGAFGGDMAEAAKLAHALKSMCNSAGARRAALICQLIEDAFNAKTPPAPEWLASLGTTIGETVDAMTTSPLDSGARAGS